MNLNEEQAEALFPDDRGQQNDIGDFYLGIDFGNSEHVTIYTTDEEFVLSEQEKDELLEDCDLDSIWHAVAHKFKVLEHLRTNENESEKQDT